MVLEKVEDLIEASDTVQSLPFSFVCLLRPWDFRNFLVSALDRPFQVFTLKSHFFIFFLLSSLFHCPIMHLKIQNLSQTGECFIKMILAE